MKFNRIKVTFENYMENPFVNAVRFKRAHYGSNGVIMMFSHLNKIEQKVLKFLQSASSDLTDDFKKTCLEMAEKRSVFFGKSCSYRAKD